MSKNTKNTTVDIDYADQAVPKEGRKGFLTMFMIMLGFTFFSASMWVGQQMAAGLDLSNPFSLEERSLVCIQDFWDM